MGCCRNPGEVGFGSMLGLPEQTQHEPVIMPALTARPDNQSMEHSSQQDFVSRELNLSQIAVESASELELNRERLSQLCASTPEEGFLDRLEAHLPPNLPMFVDSLLRRVWLLHFEPRIPVDMVRTRWVCVRCLLSNCLRVTDFLASI
jgi:hypothetical protein